MNHRRRISSPALALLALSALLRLPTLGLEPVNPNLTPAARTVLDYLESVYGKKMLSGYNVYVHTPDDYEQTGMQAAIWGRDMEWLGDAALHAEHARRHGYILTLHWHWSFDEDSAWTGKRKQKVDVGRVVTPGTREHAQCRKELSEVADRLQVFADAGIPVLWRPLHEIDGGWFWWTDKQHPEHTAKLWRMLFDYLTHERKLNNLIWVYSAGVGKKTAKERKAYYPGAEYVDISGIDVYGVDPQKADPNYEAYFKIMEQVSPGKMLAMGEGDAIPNPDLTRDGKLPPWLYALPWWGAPSSKRSVEWATFTMRHDHVITLDELPPLGPGPLAPHVGILEPRDDGSAVFETRPPPFKIYATDRDGAIKKVTYQANGRHVASPETLPAGCYTITATAEDDSGLKTTSNRIRVMIGLRDAARGRPVTASSGEHAEQAVDGNYFTSWSAAKTDEAWIQVDLGAVRTIDRVNLMWGWKIHPSHFSIQVSKTADTWTTVHTETDRPYQNWEAADRITFPAVEARYVRMLAAKRAGNQTWSGYKLTAFEVPVTP